MERSDLYKILTNRIVLRFLARLGYNRIIASGGNFISGFLLRAIINSIILFIFVAKIPGITIDTLGGTLLGVSALGLTNAFIRPALAASVRAPDFFLLTTLTCGINLLAVFLTVKILPGVKTPGLFNFTSLSGFLFFILCSTILTKFVKDR